MGKVTRAVMLMALLGGLYLACVRDRDSGGEVRMDLPLQGLRDGDLVFRCGVSLESDAVVRLDMNKGVYSHVGIAINDGGNWRVIHAVPGESVDGVDRVKEESIDTFFLTSRAVHGAAMRLDQCDDAKARQAAMWAQARCGMEFDDHYDWNDTTRLYCTELVQRAYETVGVDVARGHKTHVALPFFNGDIVFPSDIARNDSLCTLFSF